MSPSHTTDLAGGWEEARRHTAGRVVREPEPLPAGRGGPRLVAQRTPATWVGNATVATVAGFTGSATYWQPVAGHVAAYGALAPGDVAGRLRILRALGVAIAAWRANQASNLWLSSTDRAKAAVLTTVETLIAAERQHFYDEAAVYTSADIIPVLGAEGAVLTTAALGARLDQLFRTSTRPEHGVAVTTALARTSSGCPPRWPRSGPPSPHCRPRSRTRTPRG